MCLEMSTSSENLRCTGVCACLVNENWMFYKQAYFVQAGARILVSADGIAIPHICA